MLTWNRIQSLYGWLGHTSLNTTTTYTRADLDPKRQALMQVFPDAPRPPRGGRVRLELL